jgi:hypothetical protein
VPVDVTVKEPRSRVVGEEPNRNIISWSADAHDVTDDRVDKVVCRVTSATDDMECVAVQMDGVLPSQIYNIVMVTIARA